MSDDQIPLIIAGLVIHPGDTLIVRVGTSVSPDAAARMHDALMERLPALADIVVCGADGLAVFRPEVTP